MHAVCAHTRRHVCAHTPGDTADITHTTARFLHGTPLPCHRGGPQQLLAEDLVRAGGRLLLGGRRSRDWTRTHHATDAAEAAAEMLEEILHHGGLGKYPDDQLATLLQNLLAAAADGVHVLVGAYPHAGEAEEISAIMTHPADVIALATGGSATLTRRPAAGGPQAIHGQAKAATAAALPDGGNASDGERCRHAPTPVDHS